MLEDIRQGDIPGVQLRHRQQLAVSAGEAWRWLSEPSLQQRWLADLVEPGSGPRSDLVLTTAFEGTTLRERASTLERAAPNRWVLAWRQPQWPLATRLTIGLRATAAGTQLSVFQEDFAHLPLSDCLTIWELYRRRWRWATARLAERLAESREPPRAP